MERVEKYIKNNIHKPLLIKNMALILCVCFIVVSLLSTAFILTHVTHNHDHGIDENCSTCIHLATAENLLKHLTAAIVSVVLAFALFSFISFITKPSTICIGLPTLISLKVRLNN